MTIRDIKLAQKARLDTRAEKSVGFPATIVEVDGDVHPPNRPNYVWVLEQNKKSNVLMVLNIKVASVEGIEVWVRESPLPGGELEVWGLFLDHLDLNEGGGGSFSLPLHAPNHIFRDELSPPIDPVMVYQPALGLLKTTTDATLSVTVAEHRYIYENNLYIYGGTIIDLSSYVPVTVNNKVGLLLALDVISNLIVVTSGVETLSFAPTAFPTIQSQTIPSSFITLITGQTQIDSKLGDVIDARSFMGLTSSHVPPPERNGDILISHNGSEWERGLPVTDIFGEIVVDSNGIIITV